MSKSELLANKAVYPTCREPIGTDRRVDNLLEELLGYKKQSGKPVDMIVFEAIHDRNAPHDSQEWEQLPGYFIVLSEFPKTGARRLIYNPVGELPKNGVYTPKPTPEILEAFDNFGFEFCIVTPLNTLTAPKASFGRSEQDPVGRNLAWIAGANLFESHTGMPLEFAFRFEERATLAELRAGKAQSIDVDPEVNIKSLRGSWIWMGITQNQRRLNTRSRMLRAAA